MRCSEFNVWPVLAAMEATHTPRSRPLKFAPLIVAFMSIATTGCAACGDCGHTFFGGGEFTIALSGDIEGVAHGRGLTQPELSLW